MTALDHATGSAVLAELGGLVRWGGMALPVTITFPPNDNRVSIQVRSRNDVRDWADLLEADCATTHAGQYATSGQLAGTRVDMWYQAEPEQPSDGTDWCHGRGEADTCPFHGQSVYGLDLARAVAADRQPDGAA